MPLAFACHESGFLDFPCIFDVTSLGRSGGFRLASVGGPSRNFNSPAKGLANSWPEKGPRLLWSRALVEGYSGMDVDGGKLYTMYRAPARLWQSKFDQEVIIAIDAKTGKTVWEHHYDAPFEPRMKMENGPGSHITPLVAGSQVFSIGVTGKFYCQDKQTGKILWYHDLLIDYQAPARDRGIPAVRLPTRTRSSFRRGTWPGCDGLQSERWKRGLEKAGF